jgi:hypothetical protein
MMIKDHWNVDHLQHHKNHHWKSANTCTTQHNTTHEEVLFKILFKKRNSMKFKVDDHDGAG